MELEYQREGIGSTEEPIFEVMMVGNFLTKDTVQEGLRITDLVFCSLDPWLVSGNLVFEIFCKGVPAMSASLDYTNNVIYGEHLLYS